MVHTRPFETADLLYLPRLATSAFSNTDFFKYLRPYHALYPHHSEWSYAQKIRVRAVTPGDVIRVAVADDTDSFTDLSKPRSTHWSHGSWFQGAWVSEETQQPSNSLTVAEDRILGYTVWERRWPSNDDARRQAKARAGHMWPEDNFIKKLERLLFSVADKYTSSVGYDRSSDPPRLARLRAEGLGECAALSEHIKTALKPSTGYITCIAVVVDPLFHGKGIGKQLMQWGLRRAEDEGVPILLIASPEGCHLYLKLGFESLGSPNTEGFDTDTVMVYWPKGVAKIEAPQTPVIDSTSQDQSTEAIGDLEAPV